MSGNQKEIIKQLEESLEQKQVNHPDHYNNNGMECIEEMILVFGEKVVADFCLCNVWKYRYRAPYKGKQLDMAKADYYMDMYKKLEPKILNNRSAFQQELLNLVRMLDKLTDGQQKVGV